MWGVIALLVLAAFTGSIIYLVSRVKRYGFRWAEDKSKKEISGIKKTVISLLVLAVLFAVSVIAVGTMNTVVCFIHLVIAMLICDLAAALISKIRGNAFSGYYSGPAAVIITILYLVYGYYSANHVSRTEYFLENDRLSGSFRIVHFADAHVGTTFDGSGLNRYIDMINAEEPDAVFITGDFIDDFTAEDDITYACQALGKLKTKYGVYFSFGNHDNSFYGDDRGYFLASEMKKNGVVVLEDETAVIDGRICLVGRNDVSDNKRRTARKDFSAYTEFFDNYYTIVMDHQPNDYDNEASAGADLVLSGHTHGGQFFPINRAGEWIGANDWTYGYLKKGSTEFIVTSGISDWAFIFKTGCHSEYNVITINGK